MDSELNESIKDLIRKVMYYVINYEIETGEDFPEIGWYDVSYAPEFVEWVSILERSGLVDIWVIQDRINRIRQIYRSKNLKKLQENIKTLRERFDFYNNEPIDEQSGFFEDYVTLEVQLAQLEKIENTWSKEIEKIHKNVENIIDKLILKAGHGPMKLIGSMISIGTEYGTNIEFDDYKIEPTYTEFLEQQFKSHIPDLARRGITFEQFLSNPQVDLEAYDLFTRMPDLYKERVRSVFLSAHQALQQLLELVPSLRARGITYEDVVSNPNSDPYAHWLFQFIQDDTNRKMIFWHHM